MSNILELYKKAVKKGYKFKTSKGLLSLERLFQLSETELDETYISLEKTKKPESGLIKNTRSNNQIDEKLELIKDVFETKKSDREKLEKARVRKAKKQAILAQLEKNENDLSSKGSDELKKMLEELDKE